jgi:hypothetical protein
MAFVAVAATVGGAVGLGGTAAIIGGGAIIGAGVGGAYSAITGDGNVLNSMLTGGLIGGAGAYGLGAMGFGGAPIQAQMAGPFWGGPAGTVPMATGPASTAVSTPSPALQAAKGLTASSSPAAFDAAAMAQGVYPEGAAALKGAGMTVAPDVVTPQMIAQGAAPVAGSGPSGMKMLGYGLAGTAAMQLLGGRKGGGAGQMPDPGTIRPYEYTSKLNEPTGNYPSPYATASYDAAGMPIMDTRERNYFTQTFTPMQPYSARTGTPNPNVPTTAARGGIMQAFQAGGPVERMSMANTAMNPQGGLYPMGMIDKTQYATPIQRPVSSEMVMDAPAYERSNPMLMAGGGSVDLEEERQKLIMKNIKGASTKELEKALGALNEQDFLRRNMPGYAESMRPSISSMVEGAQYGDRMAQAYGGQPRDINVMPTSFDPQSGNYGGIAQIGQNIDPQTRVNAMANIQRTPFDRNTLDAVRRVGVGVDRQIGKDANLSAFYEQDPMGRNKMGGARFTQRFVQGGMSNLGGYSDGGRMLKGPGDGMSDDIPGVIGGKQPARLADGEFVVPADVVSHLGNGSTDAGAKRLYAMMDKVRKARTGNKKQGKQIKAEKYLPA